MVAGSNGLLERIVSILRPEFPDDTIDASLSGVRDNVHVIVVSRKLDGMTERQKQEHIWSLLESGGSAEPELQRISMILPLSLEELKR